jgi:hypothetical protein
VQAISRFLQLVTLATCAHQGDAYDAGGIYEGYFVMDLVMYMLSTFLTILGVAMVAGLGLRRYGFMEFGFRFATTQLTPTRDDDTQTDERHTHILDLSDITVDGLRKVVTTLGFGGPARTMLKQDLAQAIRAHPRFQEVVF